MANKRILTVFTANYNHERFLGQCLESICRQSRPPNEYLLVDDCSPDQGLRLMDEFASRYPFVRVLRNEKNLGAVATIQRACGEAQGDYITGVSADDYVLPGFYEKAMSLLEQHPQAGLCCGDPVYINEKTNARREIHLGWANQPSYLSPEEFAERVEGGFVFGHTAIVNRSFLLGVGGYLPELKWHCDWFANLAMAFRHGICYIPEPVSVMRESGDTYSGRGRRDWNQQKEVLERILNLLKSPSYRDVLPHFVRGSVMSHFGDEIVRLIMSDPTSWNCETLMLIQEPLWRWVFSMKQKQAERQQRPAPVQEKFTAERLFEKGHQLLAQGDATSAFNVFVKLTQEHPNLPEGHCGLAHAALALGKPSSARMALDTAGKLDCPSIDVLNQVGAGYFKIGDSLKASQIFHKALGLDAANLEARNNLAVMAVADGRLQDALEHYRSALKHHPDDINLLVDFGKTAAKLKQTQAAAAAFARARTLAPEREDIRVWLQELK